MPTRRGGFAFDEILPRLVAAYEVGRLVPFIGAGMSVPTCTLWWQFIARLEQLAGISEPTSTEGDTAPADLVRRANAAVRSLKAKEPGAFVAAVRKALAGEGDVPPQTLELASLAWPLVLSTNWDNCYATAFRCQQAEAPFDVVGRSPEDCQRVLSSLNTSWPSLLWALQGHLNAPCKTSDANSRAELEAQLVVGHDEYRRVTYTQIHFRRAFAEVFRHRSLLFLGSGIRESYLQELFGEVLEMYGPCAHPHYAILPAGEVDADFMLGRFQIVVVEYGQGEHTFVTESLQRLRDEVERTQAHPKSWSFGALELAGASESAESVQLDVIRAVMPARPETSACLAFSVGGRGRSTSFANDRVHAQLQELGIAKPLSIQGARAGGYPVEFVRAPQHQDDYLTWWHDPAVYLVRARKPDDTRDLRLIRPVCHALFDHARAHGLRRIHMPLLGAGGTEHDTQVAWRWRGFPQRYSFIQIVRALAEWRQLRKADLRVSIYVTAPTVGMEIASGRIDVVELLSCVDLRFWAEVSAKKIDFERRLFQTRPDLELGSIAEDLNLSPEHWTVEVSPATSLDDATKGWRKLSECRENTLEDLGVLPGSVLNFRRIDDGA